MTNYGWNANSDGWDEDMKHDLAEAIAEAFEIPIGRRSGETYVEVDGLYPGVRVRSLKHLFEDVEKDDFVERAEAVYNDIMYVDEDDDDDDEEPDEDDDDYDEDSEDDDEPGEEDTPDESDAENGADDDSESTDDAVDDETPDVPKKDPYSEVPSLTTDE